MATARRQSADPLERLDTPAPATRALLHYLPILRNMFVVEPCAGAAAISLVLTAAGSQTASFDLEPRHASVGRADTNAAAWFLEFHGRDRLAVVTNTPFSLAASYWRHAAAAGFGLIVLLVRVTWLEACKDREDVRDPDGLIILPRLRFTGPGAINPATGKPYTGGDSATVAWAIWQQAGVFGLSRPIIRVSRPLLRHLSA